MLMLARKDGESITIVTPEDQVLEVTIFNNTNQIKVGIKAPAGYQIIRNELLKHTKPIKCSNSDQISQ